MDSLGIALVTLACSVVGITLGGWLRRRLPDHQLRDDAKDVVKTATGMIATLVALVIGLLVSSSKSSFDGVNAGLTQAGAKFIILDAQLARYGTETAEARSLLRTSLATILERLRPAGGRSTLNAANVGASSSLEDAYDSIRALAPADEAHKFLQAQSLQLCGDIIESRWLLIEGAQSGLPAALLVVLISWLSVLFLGLGLLTPAGLTARAALLVSAVSMAGAVFLILEMSRPMEGSIRASTAPLLKAQAVLGKLAVSNG